MFRGYHDNVQLPPSIRTLSVQEQDVYRFGYNAAIAEGHKPRAADREARVRVEMLYRKYSPDQPREPKGTPEGGRFASTTGAGGAAADDLFPENRIIWDVDDENNVLSDRKELIRHMFRSFADIPGTLHVEGETYDPDFMEGLAGAGIFFEGDGIEIVREINPVYTISDENIVHAKHVSFELPEDMQGQGIAKKFMADSMDVYEAMGVTSIEMSANIDVGGYAWAKYGFVPDHWGPGSGLVSDIHRLAQSTKMPDATRERLNNLLKVKDPKAIWGVSDMSEQDLYGTSLGKRLLLGSGWFGRFRLSDKSMMDRFNAYTGRTKKYSPDQPREGPGSPEGGRWVSRDATLTPEERYDDLRFKEDLARRKLKEFEARAGSDLWARATTEEYARLRDAADQLGLKVDEAWEKIPEDSPLKNPPYRVNQPHPLPEEATYYHGTSEQVLADIMKEGLEPQEFTHWQAFMGKDPSRRNSVYMIPDRDQALDYAREAVGNFRIRTGNHNARSIVLQIRVPKGTPITEDEEHPGAYRLPRVPPEWIVDTWTSGGGGGSNWISAAAMQAARKAAPADGDDYYVVIIVDGVDKNEPVKKYDPNQPRAPAGSSEGGRWVDEGTGTMRVADPERYEELLKRFQVWHGTSDEAINEILTEGLIPGQGRGADVHMEEEWPHLFQRMIDESEQDGVLEARQGSVYVSSDPSVARNFAEYAKNSNPGSRPVLLQIGIPQEALERLKPDEQSSMMMNAFRHEGKIPPEWITRYRVMQRDSVPKGPKVRVNAPGVFGRQPVSKKKGDLTFYAVILVDDKAKKYDPEQPRAPEGTSEGGRWVRVGGGGAGAGAEIELRPAPGNRDELPEHIRKLKIPPAWTDVFFNPDENGDLLAIGRDAKGRSQYVYSEAFAAGQMRAKFARVQEMNSAFESMANQVFRDRGNDDADATALIMATGIRPGSTRDRGGAQKAYGATTLLGQHVVDDGKRLAFVGKKGVPLSIPIDNPSVAKMLRLRAEKAGSDGKLFPKATDKSLREYVDGLGGGSFSPKDFRTHVGTSLARDLISSLSPPNSFAKYKKMVREVAKSVSVKLGNTPTIALQSYIDPTVFTDWKTKLAIKQADYDVWFGEVGEEYDWRADTPIDDPDDTELDPTPPDVISILGFDPKE